MIGWNPDKDRAYTAESALPAVVVDDVLVIISFEKLVKCNNVQQTTYRIINNWYNNGAAATNEA